MNPVIIDDFLKHDEFKKLQTYMMSPDFQWRFMPVISHINEKGNKFQFVHLFYQNCKPISPDYSILTPVFRAINMKSLYRIKSNLLTRTPEIVENETGEEVSSVVVESDSDQKLSPVVRKLLSKNNLNPSSLNGTGKDGRITRKDIEAHIATGERPSEEKVVKEPVAEKPISSTKSTGESIPRLRKKIAENMVRSKQTSAHVMTTIEVDYEKISQLRNEIKEAFKKDEGFSLTYLPFIANATVDALKQYPVVNSSFDLDQDSHTIHSNIDLGIAVDINQEGLLVGTIKESDSYDVKALSREITSLSQKLREKNFSLEDVSGSTFTISNNGSFNSFLTSPIINQPNVAILSTESVKKKAVVVESEGNEDSIEIRHSGILSLTWDHRVFDGSTALLFLNAIKDKLENHDWSGEIS